MTLKNDKKLIAGLLIFIICVCSLLIIQNNELKKQCAVAFSTTGSQNTFCENTYISDTKQVIKQTPEFPCNINSISKETLMEIDGIGSATAEKIITYRDSINGYKNLEELLNIDGIGNATYEKLKEYLYVSPAANEKIVNMVQASEITTSSATQTTTVCTTTQPETEPLIIEEVIKYPININIAPQKLLMQLPGIGEVKSAAIIAYRQTYGYFNHSDEIMNVKGIGQSTYDNIKNLITTGTYQSDIPSFAENEDISVVTTSPGQDVIITPARPEETTTTLPIKLVNINTATKEELMESLSLSEEQAQAIVTHRENVGHNYTSIDELLLFISRAKYDSIINMITI